MATWGAIRPMHSPRRFASPFAAWHGPKRCALLALLLVLECTAQSLAQSGTAVSLPAGGKKPIHGITMLVDPTWVEGLGYRPIRVTITPVGPTTFDRTFRVRIAGSHTWNRDNVAVIQDITLPTGSTPATPVTEILTLPQHGMLTTYKVEVREDGRRLEDLSLENAGWFDNNQLLGATYPKILVISDSPVDLTAIKQILLADHQNSAGQYPAPPNAGTQQGVTLPALIAATPLPTVYTTGTGGLPVKWIDYSAIDIICLSLAEMNLLRTSRPDAWRAIEDWTRAGANLVIHGVGRNWNRRADIERALGAGTPAAGSDDETPAKAGWNEARVQPGIELLVGSYAAVFDQDGVPLNSFTYSQLIFSEQSQVNGPTQWEPSDLEKGKEPISVLTRSWQSGLIVAVDGDLLPGSPRNWLHVFQAIEPRRWNWNHRHGISFSESNSSYWNFLIAGVGLVPVGAFRLLITVFVIGIGPAQYFLLRRRNRLHLSVITIPACALLVTGALLAYVILTDGLGTKVRIRSYTQIDQRTGATVCWGRTSYYAGLAPSGGLTFAPETAVYPYLALPESDPQSGMRLRTLQWDGRQRLTKGWLPPRTPTQLLSVRSRQTNRGLAVAPPVEGKNQLAITNRLGTGIKHVWLCEAEGKLYAGDATEDRASAVLRPISAEDLRNEAKNVLRPMARLAMPDGFDESQLNAGASRYNFLYVAMGQQSGDYDVGDSPNHLESRILEIQTAAERGSLPLGKRSYVAIVDHSPEMEMGLKPDEVQDNFQIIVGNW